MKPLFSSLARFPRQQQCLCDRFVNLIWGLGVGIMELFVQWRGCYFHRQHMHGLLKWWFFPPCDLYLDVFRFQKILQLTLPFGWLKGGRRSVNFPISAAVSLYLSDLYFLISGILFVVFLTHPYAPRDALDLIQIKIRELWQLATSVGRILDLRH